MSNVSHIHPSKRGRGRPSLSSKIAIEVVRKEQLDIAKLAQALELYIHHLTETNAQKSIKPTGHSIERKR